MPAPQIPVGIGTKLGVIASSLAAIFALVATILEGDHSTETIGALIAAALPLYAVIKGRMDQATAAVAKAPAVEHIADLVAERLSESTHSDGTPVLAQPAQIDEPGNDALLADQGVPLEDLPPA